MPYSFIKQFFRPFEESSENVKKLNISILGRVPQVEPTCSIVIDRWKEKRGYYPPCDVKI